MNSDSQIPRHIQAATELKRRIERGYYKTDSHLPPVRQLGAEFGISHNAIQRAVQVLQREGLVTSEHGIGIRVLASQSSAKLPLRFGMVHPYQSGSLFAGTLHGYIDQAIEIAKHHCIVKSSGHDLERERQIVREFVESGIEGLLVWPCVGTQNAEFFAEIARYTPMAFVDRHMPDIPVPAVTLDWSGIGKDIVIHIASQGFRKILILEDPIDVSSYHELYGTMKQTVEATNNQLRFDFAEIPCAELVQKYPEHPEDSVAEHVARLSAVLTEGRYDAMYSPSDEYLDTVFACTELEKQFPTLKLFSMTNTTPTPRSLWFCRRNVREWVCDYAAMFAEATSMLHDKVHLKSRQRAQSRVGFSTVVRTARGVV